MGESIDIFDRIPKEKLVAQCGWFKVRVEKGATPFYRRSGDGNLLSEQ